MTYEDVKRIRENPDSESLDNKELSKLIDEAVKKQIPQKLIIKQDYLGNFEFLCPVCRHRLLSFIDGELCAGHKTAFCEDCGQALDWNHCGGKNDNVYFRADARGFSRGRAYVPVCCRSGL